MIKDIKCKFDSESWKSLPWKKFRVKVFRLQKRIYKAVAEGDKAKARNLQKLLLRSRAAKFLAIRQVTQLNAGKKTAGIDGKKSLSFKERFELVDLLTEQSLKWKHEGLRKISIPKKNGKVRILKVPTIKDRAWQCLIKYILEPAHEATFHARSYGFRPGRSAHDAQKILQINLNSRKHGYEKRILELDIKKCFDMISHKSILDEVIAPQCVKGGIFRCLKAGVNPEFPEQGTPQGGVVSPLLANISLNGIESIHQSVRYADDMVVILKPEDDDIEILERIKRFLAERGMEVSTEKTKVVASTDGFEFLGWRFKVLPDRRFKSWPSEENFKEFKRKVKEIVANDAISSERKTKKLSAVVRGWKNYHKYCDMSRVGSRLWAMDHACFKKFLKGKNINRYEATSMVKRAFPAVKWSENRFVNVRGDKSPYDGDLLYWSKRLSNKYDGPFERTLKKQNFVCKSCGLKFSDEEKLELHHKDGNHSNWKSNNLEVLHESCHNYKHMGKRK